MAEASDYSTIIEHLLILLLIKLVAKVGVSICVEKMS